MKHHQASQFFGTRRSALLETLVFGDSIGARWPQRISAVDCLNRMHAVGGRTV